MKFTTEWFFGFHIFVPFAIQIRFAIFCFFLVWFLAFDFAIVSFGGSSAKEELSKWWDSRLDAPGTKRTWRDAINFLAIFLDSGVLDEASKHDWTARAAFEWCTDGLGMIDRKSIRQCKLKERSKFRSNYLNGSLEAFSTPSTCTDQRRPK